MIGGIVEIAEAGRHLSVHRGFLKISEDGDELGRVPLDDITVLILSGPQVTLSKALPVVPDECKAVVINCGRDWMPVSLTLPFTAHHEAAGVLADQIDAGGALRKRLWQHLVRAKITAQASVLGSWAPATPKADEPGVPARAVVGAGLQPSLGLHHGHRGNPFTLVDDLMEPFRPLVDYIVRGLTVEGRQRNKN